MPTDEPPPEPPEKPYGDERFRVLDARFWSAIAFLVVCIIAAVVVAVWGPKIWPKGAPGPASAPSSRSVYAPRPRAAEFAPFPSAPSRARDVLPPLPAESESPTGRLSSAGRAAHS
jgi:hypothetical protein